MAKGQRTIRIAARALEKLGPEGHDAGAEFEKAFGEMATKDGTPAAFAVGVLKTAPKGARGKAQMYQKVVTDDKGVPIVPETIELRLKGPTSDVLIATVT